MKKSSFVAMILGTISGVLFALGLCMDQMLVDVTDVGQVSMGDAVTVIGRDGPEEIRAEELAARCGTITNELLAGLSPRLGLVYEGA